MVDVLALVEARLRSSLGEPYARAAVTFLGADRIEVLRFRGQEGRGQEGRGHEGEEGAGRDGRGGPVVRYATLGMSAHPMTDPAAMLADPVEGPRAELVLSVRAGRADTDKALRPLAVLGASPQVEGVVVAPGGSLDVGGPLWPGAPFTSVLVAEPGGLVEDLELDEPLDPVRFLPLLPMTPNEAAFKRVHGAQALQERWLANGTDLRDPARRSVPLD
ncbi:suppressor of fused domain protein [Streptomyces sp. NPDC046985]|uniref:suppressor of fused domain protein n=1 Tax=Streptomyces sp. NPDC046985 TaxID=3155377 RepID=UPI003405C185